MMKTSFVESSGCDMHRTYLCAFVCFHASHWGKFRFGATSAVRLITLIIIFTFGASWAEKTYLIRINGYSFYMVRERGRVIIWKTVDTQFVSVKLNGAHMTVYFQWHYKAYMEELWWWMLVLKVFCHQDAKRFNTSLLSDSWETPPLSFSFPVVWDQRSKAYFLGPK